MLRFRLIPVLLALVAALSACGGKGPGSKAGQTDASAATLQVAPEDLITVRNNAVASGPAITGSVQPQRRADLQAEVSAVVVQVLKDNGDKVRRGELLVRLDDTAIRDSLASAEEAVRAASQSFDQAERQLQRLKTLRESGMASTQQLEDAEIRRNNAQSDLAATRTRAVQARQQLGRTLVSAPFDGVVSERKVSAGDTAQLGKPLLKVMDPTSMRFEGLVSADAVADLKVGQTVRFRVNGYGPQEFTGAVRKIDPSANANTRQVGVLVEFGDGKHPQLAGLYAEGYVESAGRSALTVPAMSLVRDGDKAFVWRLKDGKVHKVAVALGERDPRRGDFLLRGGVAEGEQLIRNPTSGLKDGQKAQLVAAGVSAPASAASAVGK